MIPATGQYVIYVLALGLAPLLIVWLVALGIFIGRSIYVCYVVKYKPLKSEEVGEKNTIRARIFDRIAMSVILYLFCGRFEFYCLF